MIITVAERFLEECLQRLQSRIEVSYDSSIPEHQEALRALWNASFPEEELRDLISEQWKEMGWQGKDPSTDFRGGGFISLENLLFFARNYPKSFQDLLRKQEGDRALWEYPFAVAGVNITFMLIQMLDLEAVKPRSMAGAIFLKFLSENESAFDLLYCITFKLMDNQWLAMHASYMDFNTVMKSTRRQLERELLLEDVSRLEDLPSYSLLTR
ncbi:ELMO domain-containing protein A-like isoform X4 [Vitis riparia]|uniref:ELMO domain-containing protein A-like isoform X4 n=1 Tax=Vitis riparia TaxID=96939 RepID=UPI00155AEAE8|nr:ELMO domain-containing protein A-like isoform X4 [Vitis riparia]